VRTLRRLVYLEVIQAVAFVSLGFLALFFFFDFVDELPNLGKGIQPYRLTQALLVVTLKVPAHLYELLPIAVLIGTIFVMARLAQSSEYTILRTSGLGPWRALRALLLLGLGFTILTFATGDYLAPLSDRTAQLLKARLDGGLSIGTTGAWLKERQRHLSYNVNVHACMPSRPTATCRGSASSRRTRAATWCRSRRRRAPRSARAPGCWRTWTGRSSTSANRRRRSPA
jgi:lipopolysaccharide export system permease protein